MESHEAEFRESGQGWARATSSPVTTPAAELRAAADKLRRSADLALLDVLSNPYWESEIVPAEDQSGRYAHGVRGGMGGPAGDLAALFPPATVVLLAESLDSAAELHEQMPPGHRGSLAGCQWCADEDWPCADMRNALAVARAVLGEARDDRA